MLTVPEAASRLNRNPETIRRWIRAGRLRASKIGTQHMIDEHELDDLVAGETLPLPAGWKRTATGEPMPAIVAALRRSRGSH